MLPVSSTGHLIIFNQWFSFSKDFTDLFDVFIQAGAILAVLWYFRQTVFPVQSLQAFVWPKLWTKILVAILPILILGFLFGHQIQAVLFNPTVVASALIFNGLLLIIFERRSKRRPARVLELSSLSPLTAFKIGCFQIFALIPGMSRSASTMIGGLWLGVERTVISQFSFMMAIPVLLIAAAYSLLSYRVEISGEQIGLLAIGFLVSLVCCYWSVVWFFKFIKKSGLEAFGYYRIVLGIIILLFLS
jgi:undecaprenyl-diphosphatase